MAWFRRLYDVKRRQLSHDGTRRIDHQACIASIVRRRGVSKDVRRIRSYQNRRVIPEPLIGYARRPGGCVRVRKYAVGHQGVQEHNEELKSASEELLSANEELQSTNEELQTAKEEAQSANEELATVNEELQHITRKWPGLITIW